MSHKIVLRDAYKGYTLDQDKIITPEETVRRFRAKLKELDLDILERTVRIDNGRLGIPVYFSICGKDALEVIGTKKQMGKGCTPQQSEASAVMELAERFSFFSFCKNPANFFVETYHNLKDRALPLDMIALSVHDQSEDVERAKEIFSRLPLKWTWAYNLTAQEEVLVPFDWFYTINEFNGPSAGNCVEEALSQGISEVVERHVSSIVSRNRLKVPSISLKSISDPVALDLVRKYEKAGVKLFANDFSLDTGDPERGGSRLRPVHLSGQERDRVDRRNNPQSSQSPDQGDHRSRPTGGRFQHELQLRGQRLTQIHHAGGSRLCDAPGKRSPDPVSSRPLERQYPGGSRELRFRPFPGGAIGFRHRRDPCKASNPKLLHHHPRGSLPRTRSRHEPRFVLRKTHCGKRKSALGDPGVGENGQAPAG